MRSTTWFLASTFLTLTLAACGDDTTGTGGAGGAGGAGSTTTAQGGGSTTSQGGSAGDGGSTGDGGSSGDGGGAADILTAFCEAEIAHEEECDPANVDTLEQCLADADTTCFSNFRPEVQQPLVDCLAARTCDEGDDGCYFEAGAADPTEGQEEYLTGCEAKLTECPGAFSDDYCSITVFTTETYAALTACFDLECAEVEACIEAAFGEVCPD